MWSLTLASASPDFYRVGHKTRYSFYFLMRKGWVIEHLVLLVQITLLLLRRAQNYFHLIVIRPDIQWMRECFVDGTGFYSFYHWLQTDAYQQRKRLEWTGSVWKEFTRSGFCPDNRNMRFPLHTVSSWHLPVSCFVICNKPSAIICQLSSVISVSSNLTEAPLL